MDIETFRGYCLNKKGVDESFPFDDKVLAFKVMGKVFALTSINDAEFTVNLKCDPERAIELRESYEDVQPGYHMNKKHWNTVDVDSDLSFAMIEELINNSYDLVVSKLTKKLKDELRT